MIEFLSFLFYYFQSKLCFINIKGNETLTSLLQLAPRSALLKEIKYAVTRRSSKQIELIRSNGLFSFANLVRISLDLSSVEAAITGEFSFVSYPINYNWH